MPLDLGGLLTTGIHVSCVAAFREYLGLSKILVKVVDPDQMLGEIDDELREILGIYTTVAWGRMSFFGFPQEGWKECEHNGLTVLVPEGFRVTKDSVGTT